MIKKDLENLLKLCEDLQVQAHLDEVIRDTRGLSFSCDLLLRNMIMMIEKEKNGESFTKEFDYILNNLLGAHSHLTGEKAINTAKKYNLI